MSARSDYQIARFWEAVDQSGGPDACWPWKNCIYQATGYGQATTIRSLPGSPNTSSTVAHRQAWIIVNGHPGTHISPRSKKRVVNSVLHRCPNGENKRCCNPAHLAIGTAKDNAADRMRSDRHPAGERLGTSKLKTEQVRQIRRLYASGVTITELAKQFKVTRRPITAIVRGETWKSVT